MELARRLAWAALGSSVLLIAAAVASNATGVHLVDVNTGGEVNSHATATWVLGTFGLVFLLHAVVLFAWANEQLWPVRPRDRRR